MFLDMSIPDWLVFITGLGIFALMLYIGGRLDD